MPDGSNWTLVFSDEFEEDNRSFAEGLDAKWVATDKIHPPANAEYETYMAEAATTANGTLNLKMELPSCNGTANQSCRPMDPGFNMTSGQVSTWNKFCLTGGYVEVRVSMPGKGKAGDPKSVGFWPAIWMLGNLGRVNYQATMEGMWPYSYDTCNVTGDIGWLPPQRFPNTQCLNSSAPPHPLLGKHGRGVPEFDLAEVMVSNNTPAISQTFQVAPFNLGCQPVDPSQISANMNGSFLVPPTKQDWFGCQYQQSIGYSTGTKEGHGFGGSDFITIGVEWRTGPDGYIEWSIDGNKTWRLGAGAVGGVKGQVGPRPIPNEPMYLILNLAMSYSWGGPLPYPFYPDPEYMDFPATMHVDYVRMYQHPNETNIGCDPPDYPTAAYIASNPNNIYTDPNAKPPNNTRVAERVSEAAAASKQATHPQGSRVSEESQLSVALV